MENQTSFERVVKKKLENKRWKIFLSAAFIVVLLAGLSGTFLATPLLQAHAAVPTDCHAIDANSTPIASGFYTIVQTDDNLHVLRTLGTLSMEVYYCPSYQSVFARFIYNSTSDVTDITGSCFAQNLTPTTTTMPIQQNGCTGGLSNNQWVDTQLAATNPGDTWRAAFLNDNGFHIMCMDTNNALVTLCDSSNGAATGQPVNPGQ